MIAQIIYRTNIMHRLTNILCKSINDWAVLLGYNIKYRILLQVRIISEFPCGISIQQMSLPWLLLAL